MATFDVPGYTLKVPLAVPIPASTPAEAVHLIVVVSHTSRYMHPPVSLVDNLAVSRPRESWGALLQDPAADGLPALPTSSPIQQIGAGFASQQEPSGIGLATRVYLLLVRDPIAAGREITITWATGGSSFDSTMNWKGAVVYLAKGVAAGAAYWPTTTLPPLQAADEMNAIGYPPGEPWSAGVGSAPETLTHQGAGMFFTVCNHQYPHSAITDLYFSSPTMTSAGSIAGMSYCGGPEPLYPLWNPGGGCWSQYAHHAATLTAVFDISVYPTPPGINQGGGAVYNFIPGAGPP